MRRSRLAAALALLPLAVSTLAFDQADQVCRTIDPDGTADSGDEYELCEISAYPKEGATKVGNLAHVGAQDHATWTEEAPTSSFSSGAGGGSLTSVHGSNAGGDTTKLFLEGQFTGELDVIDVDLYLLYAFSNVLYTPDDIHVEVYVDDVLVASNTDQFIVRAEYIGGSTETVWMQDFAVTGLKNAIETYVPDAGDTKNVRIEIEGHFIDSGNWVYVYDAVEIPTELTFNPELILPFTPTLSAF